MEKVIKIIECRETVDNWGKEEVLSEQETYKLLINPEEWTDDQVYFDEAGRPFMVDDLIGQKVQVGNITFRVTEDE
jgi:hypothetical protein